MTTNDADTKAKLKAQAEAETKANKPTMGKTPEVKAAKDGTVAKGPEVGKVVDTEKKPTGTDNQSIPAKDVKDNPNLSSSEGTRPAESESTKGNERDQDDGAGGIRATMGNQSLSTVAKAGTPNSPDSTTRDIPAEASPKQAAALSRVPPDHKEENYPDDEPAHNPYGELSEKEELEITKQLDELDAEEERSKEQKPYISDDEEAPKRGDTALDNYERYHATKPGDFIVYGVGKHVLTLGDLRDSNGKAKEIREYLESRGKKGNFAISATEGPRLFLKDL